MAIMTHGDFKPGEICRADGVYECHTCRARSATSRITMQKAGTFPECPSCKERGGIEWDMIWKLFVEPR